MRGPSNIHCECGKRIPLGAGEFGHSTRCPACGRGVRIASEPLVEPGWPLDPVPITDRDPGRGRVLPLAWNPGDVVLGLYEVVGVLGEGGMGKVYRVWHRDWHSDLAVKVPHPDLFLDSRGADDFERECETWINLDLHPNTAACYFVRRFGGVPLIFAEYVAGGSLAGWIHSGQLYAGSPRDVLARVLDIAIQMAWGLDHAHKSGLVHRDVKPGNVLVSIEGEARITDFGLARARSRAGDTSPGLLNTAMLSRAGYTPAYCSPEQAAGGRVSRRTDAWSWGLTVLEMFCGGLFWQRGEVAAEILEWAVGNRDSFSPQVPRMPSAVAALLRQCFQHDVEKRPNNMGQVAAWLQQVYAAKLGRPHPRTDPGVSRQNDSFLRAANLNNRAVSMIELGKSAEAERLLEEACTLPLDRYGDAGRSLAQEIAYNRLRLGLHDAHPPALPGETSSLDLPPGADPCFRDYLSGLLLLQRGALYDAIDSLASAVRGHPDYRTDALNARGIALLLAGETRPAIRSFHVAADRAPDRLDIRRNLALAYYYDGSSSRALALFRDLEAQTVFDGEDSIRFAAVLSAARERDAALTELEKALAAPERSTAVLLTAAELLHGARTFLPGVTVVDGETAEQEPLVREAIQREPRNLRAHIDAETLPADFGFRGGPLFSRGRRVLPKDATPARLGGAIAGSYRALSRDCRWGDLLSRAQRFRALFISGMPSLALVSACALFLALMMAIDSHFLDPFFRAPHGDIMSQGRFYASRWTVFLTLTLGPALCLAFRGAPSKNLLRDTLLCGAVLNLLVGIRFPSHLFGSADVVQDYARTAFGVTGQTSLEAPNDATVLQLCLLGLAAMALWQFFYQHLTCVMRAPRPTGITARALNPVATIGPRSPAGRRPPSTRPGPAAGRKRPGRSRRIPARRRVLDAAWRWLVDRWAYVGIWLLPLGLMGQLVILKAIPDLQWTTRMYAADVGGTIPHWFLIRELLFQMTLAVAPLLICFASPRIGLSLYTLLTSIRFCSEMIGYYADTEVNSMPPLGTIPQVLLLGFAVWKCPAFIPEWRNCTLKEWDIQQMVDPLNIRRYAAPWRLVRLDGRRREHTIP